MGAAKEKLCLIGIDLSESSEVAFDFYIRCIHQPHNKLVLVHACEPFILSTNELSVNVENVRAKSLAEEKQRMKTLQEKYEEKMKAHGVRGHINIIYYSQQPGKIICEIAKEDKCSLIVIGCRDPAPGKLRKCGDVVDYVLKKANCPVVVARRKMAPVTPEPRSRSGSQTAESESALREKEERFRRISLPAKLGFVSHTTSPNTPLSTISESAKPEEQSKNSRQRRHSSVASPWSLASKAFGRRVPSNTEQDPDVRQLIAALEKASALKEDAENKSSASTQ